MPEGDHIHRCSLTLYSWTVFKLAMSDNAMHEIAAWPASADLGTSGGSGPVVARVRLLACLSTAMASCRVHIRQFLHEELISRSLTL